MFVFNFDPQRTQRDYVIPVCEGCDHELVLSTDDPAFGGFGNIVSDTENQVQLLIDADVLKDEYIGCHPCINTSSLKIKTADLMEKILPAVHHEPILVDLPWEE